MIQKRRCRQIFALLRIINVKNRAELQWIWLGENGEILRKSAALTINEDNTDLGAITAQDIFNTEDSSYSGRVLVIVLLNNKFFCSESFILEN